MSESKNYLRPGSYEGLLWKVEDKMSKKGNPMWVLYWDILADDGTHTLRDWIVKGEKGLWKLEPLAEAFGQHAIEEFVPQDYLEMHLTVVVEIERDGMGFDARNTVVGYRKLPVE